MCKQRVQFDNGPLHGGTDFVNPVGLIKAETPAEVPQAFTDLQNAQSNGYWLAGYASYELGYVLCPKLEDLLPPQRALPLLHFGVFEHPHRPSDAAEKDPATVETPQSLWDLERYQRLCEKQPVPHCALVDLGGTALLSRSPELFFSLSADGQLTTKPMKGTAPRGASAIHRFSHRAVLSTSQRKGAPTRHLA